MITTLAALASMAVPSMADDQAFLGIFAETKVQKMFGMKMPEIPGMDLSAMPGMEMILGKPTRTLDVRLWSPSLAPQNAAASIAPPPGLKQGDKLDLAIYRPKPGQLEPEEDPKTQDPGKVEDFTIKIYWGSSKTVRPGQPRVIKFDGLTPEQKAAIKAAQAKADKVAKGQYFYKPDWTTAYWPTEKQPGKIAMDAKLPGLYALTTNYTGNVELEAPAQVDFLAPIEITSPASDNKIDLTKFIPFQWKPIPNAIGLYASIMGFVGKNTMIMWYSSEVFEEGVPATNWDYLQMAEVRQYVEQKKFMPGNAVNVDVPEGIFKDTDMTFMQMVGYGPGAALAKAQPLPRIQTKTTLMLILGGKAMDDMGMPDFGEE